MRKMICLLLAFVMVGLTGCGQEEKKAEPVKETMQTADIIIGNQSEQAYSILLKNSVGQDITGVMIKTAEQQEYPSNMMKTGDMWAQGKTAQLFYTPETTVSNTETEKALNPVYQVKVMLADGSEAELSSLGIEDIDGEAELICEDSVLFVTYKSKSLNSEVSTKEQELAAKAQREAEEMEQVTPAQTNSPGAVQQYQQPASQEQVVYEQPVSEEPASYEEPAYVEPASIPETPVQNEESCLGEVEIVNP